MYKVEMYKTYDNKVHCSLKEANKHLDKLYGDVLLPLSSKLVQIEKYQAMSDFIDENLDIFLKLQQIKTDMNLTGEDDE